MCFKHLTRLRLGLIHLREHKFRHNFQYTLNPICTCGSDIETTSHFFLHCHNFSAKRKSFLDKIKNIDENILNQSNVATTETLLFGNPAFHVDKHKAIISATVEYITSTERFNEPLL